MDKGPFSQILNCLKDGEEYDSEPPSGPPRDLPSLSEEEMEDLRKRLEGSDLDRSDYSYSFVKLSDEEEDQKPKFIPYPDPEEVKNSNIYAIDGSNQVVGPSSFKMILSRGSLVKFEYRSKKQSKYHLVQRKDANAAFIAEEKVFEETVDLFGEEIDSDKDDENTQPLLDDFKKSKGEKPFIVRASDGDSNPGDEAMGWGVKFQQTLELEMLDSVSDELPGVVIRDGPLFSTSASKTDTIKGLDTTQSWSNQVLVSVSKRVGSSTLLIEALEQDTNFREAWFPDQNLSEKRINSLNGDSAILNQLLNPGERTPWLEAVNRQRKEIVEREKDYTPLVCYYMSRNKPHSVIRLEVPKFMMKERPEHVEKAVKMVAWQNELGKNIPMIQKWADRTCQLKDEKRILRRLIEAKLADQELNIQGIEPYE